MGSLPAACLDVFIFYILLGSKAALNEKLKIFAILLVYNHSEIMRNFIEISNRVYRSQRCGVDIGI
jgi:hypothetical protein